MTPYEIEVQDDEQAAAPVVVLGGELDLTNVSEVERQLRELVDRRKGLVLDLNRVTFLDSAALHMLFRIARRLDVPPQRLGIVLEPTAVVARTLAIVGLDGVADVRSSAGDLVDSPAP